MDRRTDVARSLSFLFTGLIAACSPTPDVDLVLRGGTIYDGSGGAGVVGDVAIHGDSIVAVGEVGLVGAEELDVTGLAVAPGFINMLSWASGTLLVDGTAQSDLRQGVTLEVFGEGWSFGPVSEPLSEWIRLSHPNLDFAIEWESLGEYLQHLERRGVSPNVASFVGATSVRMHELGNEDRAPNEAELERMKELVRTAMQEGALGVGSSLIYAPAFYADTEELVELVRAAAEFDGMYISHMRSEGNRLLESVDELIRISREAGAPAEIYHLKAAGRENYSKLEAVFARVESARAEGLDITANMYTYAAAATGLDGAMPPWVQEGGHQEWVRRLSDPAIRARVANEMRTPTDEWENLMLLSGSPENVLLTGFAADSLRHLTGMTLAEVAQIYGTNPEETAIDLVVKDGSRVGTAYFLMDEDNVRAKIAQPWMSFGSDEEAPATVEPFTAVNSHPRAYGTFSRLLGRYSRDEQVIPLEEAVRRLTTLPATNLKLKRRGALRAGFHADVVVFDPATITDHATHSEPHQYSTGVLHVFVNGTAVLRGGSHTGALPGRVVRGPGWTGWER